MNNFWNDYPEITEELNYVNKYMNEVNKSSEQFFNDSFGYLFSSGGKMLRPAFVLVGSRFSEEKPDEQKKNKIKKLASAVEMLHSATLVHDDIIDESFLRRGKETIHSKYSKEYAVYMGDYLFSQCFLMLSETDISRELLNSLAKGIAFVCKSEMLQNYFRYNYNLTVREYLKIISGKTAALFSISLSSGAKESGVSEDKVKKLSKIGHYIGMAFQLIDDLLDYRSDEKTLGKEVKSDIFRGYYSLPLIISLKTSYSSEIKEILEKENIVYEDTKKLIEITNKTGAIKQTEDLAEKYTLKAVQELQKFEESQGKKILSDIIPKLLTRKY